MVKFEGEGGGIECECYGREGEGGALAIFKSFVRSSQASHPHCHNLQVVQVEVACV